jgi:hypothetical protein
MFDQVCSVDSSRSRRRLCILLITNNIPSHESQKEAMRKFILENGFNEENFRFMYIFESKQKEFIKSLLTGSNSTSNLVSYIIVLWRQDHNRIQYESLSSAWDTNDEATLNKTRADLFLILAKFAKSNRAMSFNTKIGDLIDENENGLWGRLIKKILVMTDNIGDNISKKDVLPFLSVAASFGFIMLVGFIMQHLV